MNYVLEPSQAKDIEYLSSADIPKYLKEDLEKEWVRSKKKKSPSHTTYFDQDRLICTCDYPILVVVDMGDGNINEPSPAKKLILCPHTQKPLGKVGPTSNHNIKWEH